MDRERTYLDTNIIADRIIGEKDIIAKIDSVVGEMLKYCSAFVVSEHKRTFLQTLRFLWTLFKDVRDSEEVLNYIESKHWRSSQEKNRYIKIFNWIMYETQSCDDALVRLENLIFEYDHFFFRDIDVLESEVDCPLSEVQISSRAEILRTPLACSLRCSMSDFLENQRDSIVEIEEKIRTIRYMGLVVAVLQRVIGNPEEYDEDMCRTLADVIIVVEAPDYCSICSSNIKHIDPICTALGKKFLPLQYE